MNDRCSTDHTWMIDVADHTWMIDANQSELLIITYEDEIADDGGLPAYAWCMRANYLQTSKQVMSNKLNFMHASSIN